MLSVYILIILYNMIIYNHQLGENYNKENSRHKTL